MKKLLREPLLHFLLAGALLFALYGQVADPAADRPDRIVVGEDRVAMLVQAFERTWMRPPTPQELDGLIEDYVTEEVLYREALALGLDRDDLIVRRRMRQKMEFLNDGLSEREPEESALRAFLEENPERFEVASRTSFAQVFVTLDRNERPEERAGTVLSRLREGSDADALGDRTQLPRTMSRASPSQVAGSFGSQFAEALADVPVGEWSGPLASSFGLHLVRVAEREPARQPAFEEVRAAVEREWAAEQRRRGRERFYEAMRGRYEVEIRRPGAVAAEVASQP